MTSHKRRIFFASLSLALLAACGGGSPAVVPPAAANAFEILELAPGEGAPIASGQQAVVQYTGWLYAVSAPDKKGKKFDSSRDGGQPFRFVVGAGQVIKGWDRGVLGMKVGGRRRLIIPSDLAYGDSGAGGVIPPGATLVFDVDLVGIE
jgi:FKBP-type peptidyl-prolyl cis-trans isomerase FkpA